PSRGEPRLAPWPARRSLPRQTRPSTPSGAFVAAPQWSGGTRRCSAHAAASRSAAARARPASARRAPVERLGGRLCGALSGETQEITSGPHALPARYRSVRLLATGGMGEVYAATDEMLEREVAVKVLSDRYAGDDEIRRRFTREALAAARLSGHRYVVTIYDVGDHEGHPYIVMAYMAGGSGGQRV